MSISRKLLDIFFEHSFDFLIFQFVINGKTLLLKRNAQKAFRHKTFNFLFSPEKKKKIKFYFLHQTTNFF